MCRWHFDKYFFSLWSRPFFLMWLQSWLEIVYQTLESVISGQTFHCSNLATLTIVQLETYQPRSLGWQPLHERSSDLQFSFNFSGIFDVYLFVCLLSPWSNIFQAKIMVFEYGFSCNCFCFLFWKTFSLAISISNVKFTFF